MRQSLYPILFFFLIIISCKSDPETLDPIKKTSSINLTTVKSEVYTTAHNSSLKLILTDSLKFEEFKQPLETEASIIIDASKEFQTFFRYWRCFN